MKGSAWLPAPWSQHRHGDGRPSHRLRERPAKERARSLPDLIRASAEKGRAIYQRIYTRIRDRIFVSPRDET